MSRFDLVPNDVMMQACRDLQAREDNAGSWPGGEIPKSMFDVIHGLKLDPSLTCWLMVAEGYVRDWAVHRLVQVLPDLASTFRAIGMLGGNLPDDWLTSKTGPNDAVQRGLMYVEARRLAREALEKI